MCGIVGVVSGAPVNQLLYDSLLLLQHRGQDAAGIATSQGNTFNMFKAHGLVRDVFRTRNMRALPGNSGIGQVRYPTAGSSSSAEEAQPFYVNAPFGITFAHNGNLTNWESLREELFRVDRRHMNTNSDSEVLLNVLAHELHRSSTGVSLDEDAIFKAVAAVHRRVRGAYAVVAEIAGYGMLAFRDPFGIRPLCLGKLETDSGVEWMIASESVALEGMGFKLERDVAPGEAIFIDRDGRMSSRQCADNPQLSPCIFEYVYFARPDSLMDGVSVYGARLRMGEYLADKVARNLRLGEVDVVIASELMEAARALQRGLVTEDRTLLYGRYFADKYWGYVRAAVKDDALHLIDFAFREAQADTLIYLLRWSAETARERGCARIETRRDMRRLERMCRHLGWRTEWILDTSN